MLQDIKICIEIYRSIYNIKLPIQWVQGILSPGVKRPGPEADRPPHSSAEVRNAWRSSFTPNTSSWRGASLAHDFSFAFTFCNTTPYPVSRILILWPNMGVKWLVPHSVLGLNKSSSEVIHCLVSFSQRNCRDITFKWTIIPRHMAFTVHTVMLVNQH